MASTTATWSPSSLQLRFALNCGNCRNSSAVLRRSHFKKLNHPVRLRCAGERPRNGSLSIRSDSTADTFSGWNGSDNNDQQSVESQRKEWLGGIQDNHFGCPFFFPIGCDIQFPRKLSK